MGVEQKPGAIDTNERDLSFFEVELHARNLIHEFRKAFLKTPEFTSAAATFYLRGDMIANPKRVLFNKGSDVFEVTNSGDTEEGKRLALSVSSKGVLERVNLIYRRRDNASFILYGREKCTTPRITEEEDVKNDTRAVEGAKRVLAKLNHRPLRPLLFFKDNFR